ncbi:SDR family NAD(P)-dependent oxidoreductase [Leucothrix pacifica]|uniref:Gluconate 5-dehydrogenase n=1 Tax=Leucothrix pacifica TaxID=1247513 RepID=A0A317C3L0_9GAMM|nr:SDR family oxidoreductase [Leucothrix pacifica]PWQ92887.1 gluconate 5-dehydrogenase [Leucothrix pacifica]
MTLFDLSGKVALVTGATSGIGSRQAIALSNAGASVILVGRREDRLTDQCKTLRDQGRSALYIVADLCDESCWDDLVSGSLDAFGQVDILCNTAGVNLRQAAEDVTPDSWDQTQTLNLKAPFFLAQKLVPQMKARGWGRIINVASLQSERAFQNGIAYGASKGGVTQLTRAMAEAWSSDGINCNAIAPGFFPTELTQAVFEQPELTQKLADQTAIGRNGDLSDLDGTCIYLASRASDYVTGQVIYIDGGFTAK